MFDQLDQFILCGSLSCLFLAAHIMLGLFIIIIFYM